MQTANDTNSRTALFPGSFDPFTLGHKIVVDQGLELFERIVIAVGVNTGKKGLLAPENRARLIRDLYRDDPRVEVVVYNELTGKVCRQLGISTILRGLRNTVDFEYERNIMQVTRRSSRKSGRCCSSRRPNTWPYRRASSANWWLSEATPRR